MMRKGPTAKELPPVRSIEADVRIPNAVWCNWKEDGKARQLRRALTTEERAVIEARRDELLPAVEPHGERDADRVALALTDMFGGFPSMRARDDGAVVARIDSARRVLVTFPAWAIEAACTMIQSDGVWRDEKFDRQWPPSDAEIVSSVREKLRMYSDRHRSAVALLEATVEEPREPSCTYDQAMAIMGKPRRCGFCGYWPGDVSCEYC